jgi:hypothetical protein
VRSVGAVVDSGDILVYHLIAALYIYIYKLRAVVGETFFSC